MKRTFVVDRSNTDWPSVTKRLADDVVQKSATYPVRITVEEYHKTRSLEANAAMWAALADISEQVEWFGQKLSAEDWKDLFTGALRKARSVPGIDGGVVLLGQRTSSMTKREMADLLDFIGAFGADKGVQWSNEAAA